MKKKIYKLLCKNEFLRKKLIPYYSYQKRRMKLLNTVLPNLKKQLAFSGVNNTQPVPAGPKILIPYNETGHYILYMMLILAKALQIRGARVKFLYCDRTLNGCERINVHNSGTNVCRDCALNQKYVLPLFGLDTAELKDYLTPGQIKAINEEAKKICGDFPDSYLYQGIDLIPTVNDSVLRFYYGGEAKSKKELAEIRAEHLATAMMSMEVARRLHREFQPDIILSLMFVYSAFQPYFDFYKKNGVKTMTVDMTYEDSRAIQCSNMDLYFSDERFRKYLDSRKAKSLTQEETVQLSDYLKDRFSGKTLFFQTTKIFDNNIDPESLLKIDKNKRNIFLFSNVFWDIGMSQTGILFKSIVEWLITTIDLVKDRNDCHVYIKPHPVEIFDSTSSLKSVSDYIYEKYHVLPDNVSIIPPEMRINTYKLFPFIDLGVVYNGTLGLEMSLHDIPVAVVGMAPYGNLGICHEPHTLEGYKNILLDDKISSKTIDKELAYLFAYFYFIKRIIPFGLMKPVYGNSDFQRYEMDSLEDLLPGRNYYLDHICDSILNNKIFECW